MSCSCLKKPSTLLAGAIGLVLIVWCQTALSQSIDSSIGSAIPSVKRLPRAHSHNDYEHARPLLDALDQGFTSIEADVYLVEGDLMVAHNLKDVTPERTLDKLYLRPLYERFLQNKGSIFAERGRVILLIDIKRDGEAAYRELQTQLTSYIDMLSVFEKGNVVENALTIIISGDRPFAAISDSRPRYVGIDGRLNDLDVQDERMATSSLVPLISDNWRVHFRYRGQGEMSKAERDKLEAVVFRAHQQGRQIRFWATPESELLWQELVNAGVDLIGTDDLERLATFLRN